MFLFEGFVEGIVIVACIKKCQFWCLIISHCIILGVCSFVVTCGRRSHTVKGFGLLCCVSFLRLFTIVCVADGECCIKILTFFTSELCVYQMQSIMKKMLS